MATGPVSAGMKQFSFAFAGITNLAGADAGHMRALVLNLEDNNHMTQTWTWRMKGKDESTIFRLTRKK